MFKVLEICCHIFLPKSFARQQFNIINAYHGNMIGPHVNLSFITSLPALGFSFLDKKKIKSKNHLELSCMSAH